MRFLRGWDGFRGCSRGRWTAIRTRQFCVCGRSNGAHMNVSLKALIGKLNHSSRSALESAAGLCVSRTHYDVEVEHYLMKLLDATGGDFDRIAQRFGIDRSALERDLSQSLDRLKTGNARTPSFSPSLVRMLSEAWTAGSLEYGLN